MNPQKYYVLPNVLALAAAVSMQAACGDGDTYSEPLRASAVIVDRTTHALTNGELLSLNGTYTGCQSRTGNWSLAVAQNAVLTNASLSIVADDAVCALSVTGAVTTGGLVVATPPLLVGSNFQANPSAFGGPPVVFYANAQRVGGAPNTFTLFFVYSDDPSRANTDNVAITPTQGLSVATPQAFPVLNPTYTMQASNLLVETEFAPTNNVIASVSGEVWLTNQQGLSELEDYVLLGEPLSDYEYGTVHAAYQAGVKQAINNVQTPFGGPGFSIPSQSFQSLVGLSLAAPVVYTLIIARTEPVVGFASYQTINITFDGPTVVTPMCANGTGLDEPSNTCLACPPNEGTLDNSCVPCGPNEVVFEGLCTVPP